MAISKVQDGGSIVAGEIYLATFYSWVDGQLGLTGVHYSAGPVIGVAPTYGDMAYQLQTVNDSLFQAVMAVAADILGCRVTQVRPVVTPHPLAGVATSTSSGSGANPVMPTQVSGIISVKGPFASRKGVGRNYVAFPSTVEQDADGTPTAAYVSQLQTLANSLYSSINITGAGGSCLMDPVTWTRATATANVVSSNTAKKLWATQKRRGDFGRQNPAVIPL